MVAKIRQEILNRLSRQAAADTDEDISYLLRQDEL